MSIEEIKSKYMGMTEYASIRLGTTLDSMCCTVKEVGMLFKEVDRLRDKIIECINCHNEYIHPALCPYCEIDELKERLKKFERGRGQVVAADTAGGVYYNQEDM